MEPAQENLYESECPDRTLSELFSGNLSIGQALQKLRTRLLDLSSRNRLISFRFSKARSIQFVGKINLNLAFSRVADGKPLIIKYVPDPPPFSYTQKKPDVKLHAQSLGIDSDVDFSPELCVASSNKHTPKLQALYYPADLDKLCRKIASEARTVIEETGTNMLYLVFGFLEFYDSDDSDRPMYAPLLSMPVSLERCGIDEDTRTYQYSISYSGEDIHENQTLREKLSQDFLLQMPDFDEEEDPGKYFEKVSNTVKNKRRWKVRYQLCLGFLSFGKLAIWDDLDPKKNPDLLRHSLLNEIFSGGSCGASDAAEDYEIDKQSESGLPAVIYDADSSQHSAIIDVLAGRNMVINGPPGTGKSQTITNIIAAGLNAGKKILFVSEKLAALEVVRHRLNHANLGHFCLELHSHKTQKKKLLADLQERLDAQFTPPSQLQHKIVTLSRHKKALNRYTELLSSVLGNELDLTVYEIFGKTEKLRQAVGDLAINLQNLNLSNASGLSYDDIEQQRSKLEVLGQLFGIIGKYDLSHPWWGFTPGRLAPGDDEAVGRIVLHAMSLAEELLASVNAYCKQVGADKEPTLESLCNMHSMLLKIPVPPRNIIGELLPRIYCAGGQHDKKNKDLISRVVHKIESAKEISAKAEELLAPDCALNYEEAVTVQETCTRELDPDAFSTPLERLKDGIATAERALAGFQQTLLDANYSFITVKNDTLEVLKERLLAIMPLALADQPVNCIQEGVATLLSEIDKFRKALTRVSHIAKQRGISFDGSPAAVASLGRGDGIAEVLPGILIDEQVLGRAKQASEYYLSGLPIAELDKCHNELRKLHERCNRAIQEVEGFANTLGFSFDGSLRSVEYIVTVAMVASKAPTELLDYRHSPLAAPVVPELLVKAEQAYSNERVQRKNLSNDFHLDSIPEIENLKASIRTFRTGDSFFNIFNSEWRAAKKLYESISKSRAKISAAEREKKLSDLVAWLEHRQLFITNDEYKSIFGRLFQGVDTDFPKIQKLHAWYTESQQILLRHPGFIESVDLTGIDARKVNQLAAVSPRLNEIAVELANCSMKAGSFLGDVSVQFESILRQSGWKEWSQKIHLICEGFKEVTSYLAKYIKPEVSPARAVEVLSAKMELDAAKDDFEALNNGLDSIREKIDSFLPGIAAINCRTWEEHLSLLDKLARSTVSLADFVTDFGGNNLTARKLRIFIESKLALDESMNKVSSMSRRNFSKSWDDYYITASERLSAATNLLVNLSPVGAPGKSANEVLEGLKARKDAYDIVHAIRTDSVIMDVLQNLFNGLDTDLDGLTSTANWGSVIFKNDDLRESELFAYLMNSDVTINYNKAEQLLKHIVESIDKIRLKLCELQDFGTFSWADWVGSNSVTASSLQERIGVAVANNNAILPWSKYIAERSYCKENGLSGFVTALEKRKLPAEIIGLVYEFVIYRSIGKSIYQKFPEFEDFSGEKHEKLRSEFVSLDKEIINLTGKSYAFEIDRSKNIPEGESGYRASERTEMQLLRNELGKQRRHISIRQLITRAGRAIQALKPCFMMGPMSVAQYLKQGTVQFDMVVMDEASQLRPEDALGAIARGSQLIVVGDPKQLPPTNFFDRLVDDGTDVEDDDTPAILSGSESILDICQQLFHPVRTLRWHYRSQHESLIAFSNFHFYGGKLVVFPSPYKRNNRLGVRYRYIKNGSYKDRQNLPEAQRVVDAVVEHMIEFPEESLGVVTLNQTQRDLIEDLLDAKLRNIKEAQNFIATWEEEGWPFFVKNLENVQGDERDIIFISTTFGKPPGTDKVRQNFGPISRPDGWRRLNVLFTRARRKIELFTSMQPEDIVLEAKTPLGTKALKDYLDYVKRGILVSTDVTGREADSDFEVSVGEMLKNCGYDVVPQLGVAGFFIDLAVRNPDRPGEFLAAIECDGATYHSSNSARDRDRIRQAILESLGWKDRIWRIWSTDWFYDPRRESARLLDFLANRREVSRDEPLNYEFEEQYDDATPTVDETQVTASDADDSDSEKFISSTEELFVEVGDVVTFTTVDSFPKRHTVSIVDTESNSGLHLINEHTPVAQALLNSAVGDEVDIVVDGKITKSIRLLKIERHSQYSSGEGQEVN